MPPRVMVAQPHCAKFSGSIVAVLAEYVTQVRPACILDPYLGVGGLRGVTLQSGYRGPVVGIEIEPEFHSAALSAFEDRPSVLFDCDDSATWKPGVFVLPWLAREPVMVCTSPDYGNRFADQYLGTPTEQMERITTGKRPKRQSYALSLGRPVTPGSGARHQFGDRYKSIHSAVAKNITSHLKDGSYWALNVSDFVRASKPVRVTDWWLLMLADLGWQVREWQRVETPRMRLGANSEARVTDESVILLELSNRRSVPRGEG